MSINHDNGTGEGERNEQASFWYDERSSFYCDQPPIMPHLSWVEGSGAVTKYYRSQTSAFSTSAIFFAELRRI
jgi:hypothetical protein